MTDPICFNFSTAKAGASGVFFISGGKILYRKYWVAIREARAGRLADLNQETQGLATLIPSSSANFRHNRFWAAAVRKSALELQADCQKAQHKEVINLPQKIFMKIIFYKKEAQNDFEKPTVGSE